MEQSCRWVLKLVLKLTLKIQMRRLHLDPKVDVVRECKPRIPYCTYKDGATTRFRCAVLDSYQSMTDVISLITEAAVWAVTE